MAGPKAAGGPGKDENCPGAGGMLQRAGLQSKVKALTNSNLIDSGRPVFWHPELLKALPITNLVLRPRPRTHTETKVEGALRQEVAALFWSRKHPRL